MTPEGLESLTPERREALTQQWNELAEYFAARSERVFGTARPAFAQMTHQLEQLTLMWNAASTSAVEEWHVLPVPSRLEGSYSVDVADMDDTPNPDWDRESWVDSMDWTGDIDPGSL